MLCEDVASATSSLFIGNLEVSMENKVVSIYIHIPFCVRKCQYCDFLSFPCDKTVHEQYVDALCREIREYTGGVGGVEALKWPINVATIFFGGGTPSLLTPALVGKILEEIKSKFNILDDAEISMECNPGTATLDNLREYRKLGINRLSIGLQSANDAELEALGRIHNYKQFEDTYAWAREAGFDNINIDLMSALPGQSLKSYLHSLTTAVKKRPEHISAYSLIIEENTPFWELYGDDSGVNNLPDEDTEREMYYATERLLAEAGYHRYEISNYALDGYECEHNKVYWTGGDYISFGIGASSYVDGARYNNISNIEEYIEMPGKHTDINKLSKEDMQEEYMFVGLRLMQGVSISGFMDKFGISMKEVYGHVIDRFIMEGLLEETGDRIRLTSRGIDVSNVVLSEFLL